jgi:hypothetical protein
MQDSKQQIADRDTVVFFIGLVIGGLIGFFTFYFGRKDEKNIPVQFIEQRIDSMRNDRLRSTEQWQIVKLVQQSNALQELIFDWQFEARNK